MSIDLDNLTLLGIAFLNAIVAYLAWKTQRDMKKVELATNSMKDALVKATIEASFNAGIIQEREVSDIRAKDLLVHDATAAEATPKPVAIIESIPLEIKETKK